MTNLADTTIRTTTTTTTAAALAANGTSSGLRTRNSNHRTSTSHLPSTPSRQRSRTPVSGSAHWHHHLPAPQPLEPANEWGCDLVNQNLTFPVDAAAAAPNPSAPLFFSDETFLNALAENEFSSPSTYPSFTNLSPQRLPPPRLHPSQSQSQSQSQSRSHPLPFLPRPDFQAPASSSSSLFSSSGLANAAFATSGTIGSVPPCLPPIHPTAYRENTLSTSSRFYNHALNTSFDADSQNTSQHTTLSNDILHEDEFAIPATPDTIVSDTMPSARVRATPARSGNDDLPHVKRRRTSHGSDHRRRSPRLVSHARTTTTTASTTNIATNGALNESSLFCDTDDDLFGESPTTRPDASGGLDTADGELTTIDLTEATEVPEELKKPDVDQRVKLSAFQCVICMDDVTTLTVTHCGHLYCAQCLHSSLNVEATKGKCPMCRSKIDMKPREAYTMKTKGFWPLELKLMTATRKGKRKADAA